MTIGSEHRRLISDALIGAAQAMRMATPTSNEQAEWSAKAAADLERLASMFLVALDVEMTFDRDGMSCISTNEDARGSELAAMVERWAVQGVDPMVVAAAVCSYGCSVMRALGMTVEEFTEKVRATW